MKDGKIEKERRGKRTAGSLRCESESSPDKKAELLNLVEVS